MILNNSPNKKFAIIIDSLAGGGAEKVMLNLGEHLGKQGHQVTLFVLRDAIHYDVPSAIKVVYPLASHKSSLRGFFNKKKLANMLLKSIHQEEITQAFDLILVNLHESYRIVSACALNNCYYVIHNSYIQELKREKLLGPIKYFRMRNILKSLHGKHLIGVSKGVTQELKAATLFSPASVTHIYNPFDIAAIEKLSFENAPIVESFKGPYILHVGRAAKAKRHDVLFEAMQKVDPKYKLVCLSRNEKKLNKLALKYKVEKRVVVIGFTQNPYTWMRHASLTVLSSDFEGLSMVLIESLLCNTPVVSTNCPHGPNEILQGDLSQYLSPVGNSETLAKKINQALIDNPDINNVEILNEIAIEKVATHYLNLCH